MMHSTRVCKTHLQTRQCPLPFDPKRRKIVEKHGWGSRAATGAEDWPSGVVDVVTGAGEARLGEIGSH